MKISPRNKWRKTVHLVSTDSSTDVCYRDLMWSSIEAWSIENYNFRISRFEIRPCLMYLCKVSFLTTLDIYKVYIKGRHTREYKENTCKKWPMLYSLWKKVLCLCALGFCNQHCWCSEELCIQHFLQVGVLVTYWESCIFG